MAFAPLHRELAFREEQVEQLQQGVEVISEKQDKLIGVYYENAISRELFERKQTSFQYELAQVLRKLAATITDKTTVKKSIRDSLELLQDAQSNYQTASEAIRKQLNQVFFTRLLTGPGEMRVEVNESYQELLTTHTSKVADQ